MSKFNLPSYLKGKSFSDASALIAKKFEGRTDKESVETLNELQGRLQQAQEFVKAEQEAKSSPQGKQGAQHQMPDGSMMPGASHQGDAAASAPRADGAGMPMPEQSPSMSGAQGLANKYFTGGPMGPGDKVKVKSDGKEDVTENNLSLLNERTGMGFDRETANKLFYRNSENNMSDLNMGKYKDANYFNVNKQTDSDTYDINPSSSNPQNAQGYADQLNELKKLNPNAKFSENGYQDFQNRKSMGGDTNKFVGGGALGALLGQGAMKGGAEAAAGGAAGEAAGGAIPGGAGGISGAAATAMELGKTAFGPTGIDTSGATAAPDVPSAGGAAAMGAMKGASAGMAFGPWGAAVGGVLGGAAGFVGGKKAKGDANDASLNFDNKEHNEATNKYVVGGALSKDDPEKKPKDFSAKGLAAMLSGGVNESQKIKSNEENIGASVASGIAKESKTQVVDSNTGDKTEDGENLSKFNPMEMLRYAPVGMNALQLANLKKPKKVGLDRLGNKYDEQLVDERGLQNTVQDSVNNTRNSLLSVSGGSAGRAGANILASQLQGTKALSSAYQSATAENRQEKKSGQQFNLNVDKTNLGQSNQETSLNLEQEAAYETNKSRLLSQIGEDLGGIGEEEMFKKFPELMGSSYDSKGDHLATLRRIAAAKRKERDEKKNPNVKEEVIDENTGVEENPDNERINPINNGSLKSVSSLSKKENKPDASIPTIKNVLSAIETSGSSSNTGSEGTKQPMQSKSDLVKQSELIPSKQDGLTTVKAEEMKPSEVKPAVISNTKESVSKINSTESTVAEKAKATEVVKAEVKDPIKAPDVIDTIIKEDESVSRNPLNLANKYLGIDENDVKQQDVIKGFLNNAVPGYMTNKGEVTKDQNAWCAAFVNSVLVEGDYERLDYGKDNYNLIRAKQYENYGDKVQDIDQAQDGDLLVTKAYNKATKRWSYHTGFYSGKKDGDYTMLGGNQDDKVTVMVIQSDSIHAVRRIKGVQALKKAEKDRIQNTKYFDKESKSTS
tara:strand:- start:11712 stop:14747 length:3036 start_codon:yes stop_codon:yes gene_type:complete